MQKHKPVYDTETVSARRDDGSAPLGISADAETRENMRVLLDGAMEHLNPRQREIVILFHQQGWPIAVIAEHLDMPEGTVKSHLHRARMRMRQSIEEDRQLHDRAREAMHQAPLEITGSVNE